MGDDPHSVTINISKTQSFIVYRVFSKKLLELFVGVSLRTLNDDQCGQLLSELFLGAFRSRIKPFATSAQKWISQLFRTRSTNRMSHKITRAKAIMNVSVELDMIITVSIFRIAQNARPIQRPFALN
jgi:hypothetical protein